jgi:hypothetical protein
MAIVEPAARCVKVCGQVARPTTVSEQRSNAKVRIASFWTDFEIWARAVCFACSSDKFFADNKLRLTTRMHRNYKNY